jgi:hypothetical protein
MPASGTTVLKTGSLVTTAVTADQVILSYIVSPGKKFVLSYLSANVRLTTFATTATNFGKVSIEGPSGTKLQTFMCAGPGVLNAPVYVELPEPMTIIGNSDGTTVVRIVVTPTAATSFTWEGNLGGYEL